MIGVVSKSCEGDKSKKLIHITGCLLLSVTDIDQQRSYVEDMNQIDPEGRGACEKLHPGLVGMIEQNDCAEDKQESIDSSGSVRSVQSNIQKQRNDGKNMKQS